MSGVFQTKTEEEEIDRTPWGLEKIHNQIVAELGQKHCHLDWGSELFLKPHVPIVTGALLEI